MYLRINHMARVAERVSLNESIKKMVSRCWKQFLCPPPAWLGACHCTTVNQYSATHETSFRAMNQVQSSSSIPPRPAPPSLLKGDGVTPSQTEILITEFESRWRQEFSLLQVVQTGCGVHPISYPMGTGGSFPRDKAARGWSWPLTSNQCRGQENVDLFIHSPIRLHGVVLN
jgi:hypothetical protein